MPDDDKSVPPIDADNTRDAGSADFEKAEARLLALNADIQGLRVKEAKQRIRFRWLAVALALLVILSMSLTLWHSVHQIALGYIDTTSSSFAVALIGGPIASVTAVTLAFFFGVFRRFDDRDTDNAIGGMARGAKSLYGE